MKTVAVSRHTKSARRAVAEVRLVLARTGLAADRSIPYRLGASSSLFEHVAQGDTHGVAAHEMPHDDGAHSQVRVAAGA